MLSTAVKSGHHLPSTRVQFRTKMSFKSMLNSLNKIGRVAASSAVNRHSACSRLNVHSVAWAVQGLADREEGHQRVKSRCDSVGKVVKLNSNKNLMVYASDAIVGDSFLGGRRGFRSTAWSVNEKCSLTRFSSLSNSMLEKRELFGIKKCRMFSSSNNAITNTITEAPPPPQVFQDYFDNIVTYHGSSEDEANSGGVAELITSYDQLLFKKLTYFKNKTESDGLILADEDISRLLEDGAIPSSSRDVEVPVLFPMSVPLLCAPLLASCG